MDRVLDIDVFEIGRLSVTTDALKRTGTRPEPRASHGMGGPKKHHIRDGGIGAIYQVGLKADNAVLGNRVGGAGAVGHYRVHSPRYSVGFPYVGGQNKHIGDSRAVAALSLQSRQRSRQGASITRGESGFQIS